MIDSTTGKKARKPKKNIIMMFLALLLGGMGVLLSKSYIEKQVAYYKGQLEQTETMVKIVVPKRKLFRGEVVSSNDLLLREIPEKYVDSNSVTAVNYDVAIGQRIDFDIDEGRALLWAHLEGGLSPTFSGKVPTGLRALTVRVDEINSISGFLQPKDRIDLLLTYGSGSSQQIFPLIQNLDVIATGVQTLVDKNGAGSKRTFTTITVQVSPDQAKKITLSQQVGKMTAMLRNPEDDSTLSEKPMSVASLLNRQMPVKARVEKRKPKTAKKKPGIEYIIGGT